MIITLVLFEFQVPSADMMRFMRNTFMTYQITVRGEMDENQ